MNRQGLKTHLENDVLRVTLNRPQRRNALDVALLTSLTAVLEEPAAKQHCKAILLDAEGPAFCAGMDLDAAFAQPGKPEAERIAGQLRECLELMARCPLPIIAAVQGPAIAGGAALALAADVAIAAHEAKFGYPGVRQGIVAPFVAEQLVRVVGPVPARWLLLSGQMIAADEALRLGMIARTAPNAACAATAWTLATQCAQAAPDAIRRIKQTLRTDLAGQESLGGTEPPIWLATDAAARVSAARRGKPLS